jgi:hypothetical protein
MVTVGTSITDKGNLNMKSLITTYTDTDTDGLVARVYEVTFDPNLITSSRPTKYVVEVSDQETGEPIDQFKRIYTDIDTAIIWAAKFTNQDIVANLIKSHGITAA